MAFVSDATCVSVATTDTPHLIFETGPAVTAPVCWSVHLPATTGCAPMYSLRATQLLPISSHRLRPGIHWNVRTWFAANVASEVPRNQNRLSTAELAESWERVRLDPRSYAPTSRSSRKGQPPAIPVSEQRTTRV